MSLSSLISYIRCLQKLKLPNRITFWESAGAILFEGERVGQFGLWGGGFELFAWGVQEQLYGGGVGTQEKISRDWNLRK